MLKVRKVVEDEKVIIYLDGKLDVNAARDNEAFFNETVENNDYVVVDCEKLGYISSAGLRDFIRMQKIMDSKKGDLIIRNVTSPVMDIFSTTGFISIMHFE